MTLSGDGDRLNKMGECARRLATPGASGELAKVIYDLIQEKKAKC